MNEAMEAAVKQYSDSQPMDAFLYAKTSGYADGYKAGYAAKEAETCEWVWNNVVPQAKVYCSDDCYTAPTISVDGTKTEQI